MGLHEVEEAHSEVLTVVSAAPMNPMTLIQSAIDKGLDAEQLGKLLDLQERMEKSQAASAFADAMNKAQAEMPVIVRDRENSFTKNWYATLENVNSRIKPVYTKHGLSLSFGQSESKLEGHCHLYCDVHHIGGHCKRYEGEFPVDKAGAKGNDNKSAIQSTGSTFSYARRYLTYLIFNLTVSDEDTDGQTDPFATPDQIAEINGLMDECREAGKPVDLDRFLKWLQVESMEQLGQRGFAMAVRELNRKRRGAK